MAIATGIGKDLKRGGFHVDYVDAAAPRKVNSNPHGIEVRSVRNGKVQDPTRAQITRAGSKVDPGKVIDFLKGLGYTVDTSEGKVIISGGKASSAPVNVADWTFGSDRK